MIRPAAINDPDDPRIAVFRHVRERDIAGRLGGFIAEGEVVLRALARSGFHRAQSVLIAERRLEKLTPLIASLGPDVRVFTAGQAVMDAIAGFPIHRGILAYGLRALAPKPSDLLAACQGPSRILVLVGIANHDNMGGLFRNAVAFGADAVLLDPTCCDPLYRKSIRVSVGAALCVPFAWLAPGEDPVSLLSDHGYAPLALSPVGHKRLHQLSPPERSAVLLGAEGPGLPAGLLDRCETVAIPMAGEFDSLNVAVTGGIVLHHLAFHGRPKP